MPLNTLSPGQRKSLISHAMPSVRRQVAKVTHPAHKRTEDKRSNKVEETVSHVSRMKVLKE